MANDVVTASGGRVSLRRAGPEDERFLQDVYGSTRSEELAVTGWDDATKTAFIAQQFAAQRDYYRAHYEGASYDVILVDGKPAGRLYVARWPDEIRVMDITLLPAFRGRGAGTALLLSIIAEADASSRAVTIHVERQNPAMSLYLRLGFAPVADRDVYVLMRREPTRPRGE